MLAFMPLHLSTVVLSTETFSKLSFEQLIKDPSILDHEA